LTGEAGRQVTPIPRPSKRSDHQIVFAGAGVEREWSDCLAVARNAVCDAWYALTIDPLAVTPRQYRLRGAEATKTYQGLTLQQWEYKITDGGRLLYLVDPAPVLDSRGKQLFAGRVILLLASPGHPKHTEKVKGGRKSPGRR
jgi:hypothetical protein